MKMKWVNSIGKLPKQLAASIYLGKAVLFIGAGVSVQYGMPTWGKLANQLFDVCKDKGYLSKNKIKQLKNRTYSDMEKVTYACIILDKYEQNGGLNEIIKIFKKEPNEIINTIVECMKTFNCPILTTNADKGIDNILVNHGYTIFDYFSDESTLLKPKTIIHVHGSIDDSDRMVFTATQYMDNYHKDGMICKNMQKVFSSNKVFLFLGYGAKEFEFLRQVLEQYGKEGNHKYYILREYKDSQKFIYTVEKEHFEKFGFEIIPYSISEHGYRAFIMTLESWKKEIEDYRLFKDNEELKEVLQACPDENSEKFLMDQLRIPDRKEIIFKILYGSEHLAEWIRVFYNKGLLKPKNNIKPSYKNGDGYSSFTWRGLELIQKLVEQGKEDSLIVKEILSESLALYQEDKETNRFNKLNSSYCILYELIDILLSKKDYVTDENLLGYYRVCADAESENIYIILYKLNDNFDSIKDLSPSTILSIYLDIMNKLDYRFIEHKYFLNDKIKKVMDKDPLIFLNSAVDYISNLEYNSILNLGSLINYSKTQFSRKDLTLMIEWIKYTVTIIDGYVVKAMIKDKLKINDKMSLKTAVLLATFIKDEEVLFGQDNLFQYEYLFQDLKEYLSLMVFNSEEKEAIKMMILNSGCKIPEVTEILLNTLNKAKKQCHVNESLQKNIEDDYGVGSLIFEQNQDTIVLLKNKIKDADFAEIQKIKNEVSKNCYVFESDWLDVYKEKLLANGSRMLLDNMDAIKNDKKIVRTLLYTEQKLPLEFIEKIMNTSYLYEENILQGFLEQLVFQNKKIVRKFYNLLSYDKVLSVSCNSSSDALNSVLCKYCRLGILSEDANIFSKLKKAPDELGKNILALMADDFLSICGHEDILVYIFPLDDGNISDFYENLLFGLKQKSLLKPFVEQKEFLRFLEIKGNDTLKTIYFDHLLQLYFNKEIERPLINKLIAIKTKMFTMSLLKAVDNPVLYKGNKVIIDELLSSCLNCMGEQNNSYLLADVLRGILKTDNQLGILWEMAKKLSKNYKGYYPRCLLELFKKYSVTNHGELYRILLNILESSDYSNNYMVEDMKEIQDIITRCSEYDGVRKELIRKISVRYNGEFLLSN